MDLIQILELVVLGAIAIELFSLYKHIKISERIDKHILDTDNHLERSNTLLTIVDEHMNRLNEHMIRLDEHMNRLDEHINKLDEDILRNGVEKSNFNHHSSELELAKVNT